MASEEELLEVGTVIRDRWKTIKKLGEGGFGAVFEVMDLQTKETCALKVESAKERNQVLKMEVAVLRRLQGKKHVAKFCGCGRNDKFNYVVMALLGKNLADCKRETPDNKLTVGTAVRLIYQCFEAIEDLHSIGFLHRDLKPGNYAMGKGNLSRTVIILDFGLARQFVNTKGEMRTPRAAAGFRGTVRYAPVAAHKNREMGRGDDCWCIFYMLIEFIVGQLPWKKISDKDQVGKMKEEIQTSVLLAGCPEESYEIHRHLSGLKYPDKPDYEFIQATLDTILKRNKVRLTDPYDWETGKQIPVMPGYRQRSDRERLDGSDEKPDVLGEDVFGMPEKVKK